MIFGPFRVEPKAGKLVGDSFVDTFENLSLFSDYNKETTVKGLGFKDKEKALHTLNVIKDKPLKYQVNVVATMLGRAKNHPHKTKEMDEAIQIFEKWLADYKAKKQNN